ncbi:hypothetical protein CRN65_27235 (plasmid) [Klebsiella pneumoniae]|nr:hypothetical protein CRN65_27235 [Klebsiella pneumoniae]
MAYPGKKYQQMGLQMPRSSGTARVWLTAWACLVMDRLVQGMSSDNVSDYFQQLDEAIKDTERISHW